MTETAERPLGLRQDFEVSEDVLARLRYIAAFDLEGDREIAKVANRFKYGGATFELKRFLALPLLYPDESETSFVPSLPVDSIWHAFILNTPRYREFCEKVYGKYLDHLPGKSRHETEQRVFSGPMQFTVGSLERAFEGVNKRFWRKISFCGPCLLVHKR
jgi:hypothetical protein